MQDARGADNEERRWWAAAGGGAWEFRNGAVRTAADAGAAVAWRKREHEDRQQMQQFLGPTSALTVARQRKTSRSMYLTISKRKTAIFTDGRTAKTKDSTTQEIAAHWRQSAGDGRENAERQR